MKTTYMITDGHGNQLADGLSDIRLEAIAQEKADRLGRPAYIEGDNIQPIEIKPTRWSRHSRC